jgi:hypothetical protein
MTSADSSYFVDANILVYAALKDETRHETSCAEAKIDKAKPHSPHTLMDLPGSAD